MRKQLARLGAVSALALSAGVAVAEDLGPTYTLFGTPGLIEMPSAEPLPDGRAAFTFGNMGPHYRSTLTFQALPRLTASFRYSRMEELDGISTDIYFDRSFDLQYHLFDEGRYMPDVAIGLRDLAGTGLYTSEYVVATKHITPTLKVTGGLGWGHLGSRGGFDNPLGAFSDRFKTRPAWEGEGTGGTISSERFFRGDAALFGGVEWAFRPDWIVKAEYSSDDYSLSRYPDEINAKSPWNFGLTWRPSDKFQLSAYSMYGTNYGISATVSLDPNGRKVGIARAPAPTPVGLRASDPDVAASWSPGESATRTFAEGLAKAMASEGLRLRGVDLQGNRIRVQVENPTFQSNPQAVGRVARMLTHAAPPQTDIFDIELIANALPTSRVSLSRADIERLENELGAADALLARAVISDAPLQEPEVSDLYPEKRFQWGFGPSVGYLLFDIDSPLQLRYGLKATASYRVTPNLVASGQVNYRLSGDWTQDDVESLGPPVVRRDIAQYGKEERLTLDHLTLAHTGKLRPDVYTRVTVGYLEQMYGGVSAEVLWRPTNSRLALGAEVNYLKKRDYQQQLGFEDYDTVSGHVSAYYKFDNDYVAQLDVGRYLAGDWGATIGLDRVFPNGWKVGGFATVTNLSAEEFGTGSFDKGIRFSIPTEWLFGTPSRSSQSNSLALGARDGGQRVKVQGRLYDAIDQTDAQSMRESWGTFWQ